MTLAPEQLPPPERSAEEIRQAVEEIFRRPEFRDDRSIYDRVVGWLSELFAGVLSALTGGGRGAFVAWALFGVAGAAIGYLVWRIVRDGAARVDRRAGGAATVTVTHAGATAAEWRAAADGHAAAGRWRDAVRCRWRAMVADLVERRRLQEVPGTTAGEYRRLVAGAVPQAVAPFDEGTEVFEAAWYGGRDVDATDHERLVAALERTRQIVEANEPHAASSGPGSAP